MILQTRAKTLDLSVRPLLMGVINVTPDSFSDGGKFLAPESAIARAEQLIEDGADVLDVGGESTRPGAAAVPLDEELRRVVPVVEILARRYPNVPISVDTTKAEVARRCLEEGASLINDVSALRADGRMVSVLREHSVPVILMHMRGDPRTMQDNPTYQNVVEDIKTFFVERLSFAERAGLPATRVLLDPGIGFGKTVEHNLEILRGIKSFLELGRPLVLGTSRKSFIGYLLAKGDEVPPPPSSQSSEDRRHSSGMTPPPDDRLEGTLATCLWAAGQGTHILRVHDVRQTRRALDVWRAIARSPDGC